MTQLFWRRFKVQLHTQFFVFYKDLQKLICAHWVARKRFYTAFYSIGKRIEKILSFTSYRRFIFLKNAFSWMFSNFLWGLICFSQYYKTTIILICATLHDFLHSQLQLIWIATLHHFLSICMHLHYIRVLQSILHLCLWTAKSQKIENRNAVQQGSASCRFKYKKAQRLLYTAIL